MSERIQKHLARAGVGSRRQIETWIREGRIKVNGTLATIGQKIGDHDRIQFDGRHIPLKAGLSHNTRILAYYKPTGEVCTRRDEKGRTTVFSRLPRLKQGRWISVGRLDVNTSGLLLFSNDGDLVNRLTHPSGEVEREYAVRVMGMVNAEVLTRLRSGVKLEDGIARFTDIVKGEGKGVNTWFYVVLKEGRNREVRRLWESQGVTVSRLIRVRFGSYILEKRRRRGEYWDLEQHEIDQLVELTQKQPLQRHDAVSAKSGKR